MVQKEKFELPSEKLEQLGINVSYLQENDAETLEALTSGRKTKLLSIKANVNGSDIFIGARLHLWKNEDGDANLFIHPKRAQVNLSILKTKGYDLNSKEIAFLLDEKKARLPYPIEINGKNFLVGVDKETNDVLLKPVNSVFIPNVVLGYTFSDDEKNALRNGEKINVEGLVKVNQTGEEVTFSSVISYDLAKNNGNGGLRFQEESVALLQEIRKEKEFALERRAEMKSAPKQELGEIKAKTKSTKVSVDAETKAKIGERLKNKPTEKKKSKGKSI